MNILVCLIVLIVLLEFEWFGTSCTGLRFCWAGMDWPGTLFSRKMVKLLGCLGVPSFLQHQSALLDSVLHHVLIFAQVCIASIASTCLAKSAL